MLCLPILGFVLARHGQEPISCPEKRWTSASVPAEVEARTLILSNGPELIGDANFPTGANHANLYYGEIPFSKKTLKLRLYMYHLINTTAKLDELDVRFCVGVKGGGTSTVNVARQVSTLAYPPANNPRQYLDAGRDVAMAHLSNQWVTMPTPATFAPLPTFNTGGDVLNLGMHLKKAPENQQFACLVADIDLDSSAELDGRSLIVRTVAVKPGGTVGTSDAATCVDSGAGERGWWPQSEITVSNDPTDPVDVTPSISKKDSAYFRLGEKLSPEWSLFNRFDAKGNPITKNALDKFGTKNSGLWGVNVLYRVYFKSNGAEPGLFDTSLVGMLKDFPSGQIVAGPFGDQDNPWEALLKGQLAGAKFPGYLNKRSDTDFERINLGPAGFTDPKVRYFEYFIAQAGASMLPVAWVIHRQALNAPGK